ncbi:MAG: HEAT repeat domain-containing protein [Nitriliruptorales bacterium]
MDAGPLPGAEVSAVADLLRQLARGFGAYRLFPGDLDRPGFVTAVERVGREAARVLAAGPVEVDVQGGRFHGAEGPLPGGRDHDALARVLYGRGVERLLVVEQPDRHDLASFYDALLDDGSTSIDKSLHEAGVRSIVVAELAPVAAAPGTAEDEGEAWGILSNVRAHAAALGQLEGDASEQAHQALDRFRELVADLPDQLRARAETLRQVRRTVALLPREVRREFCEQVVTGAGTDELSSRMLTSMSDADLAETLIGMAAASGGDPVAMARELVESRARDASLVELTEAMTVGAEVEDAESEEAGSQQAEQLVARAMELGREAKSDLADEFRSTSDRELDTLAAYVALETDAPRLRNVLRRWTVALRQGVHAGDRERLEVLLAVIETGATNPHPDAAELVAATREGALDIDTVRGLLPEDSSADLEPLKATLGAFGGAAVERVFELLADEQDRTRRSRLLGVLGDLADGHLDRLSPWLSDVRWYVARNAVCVIERAGSPEAGELLDTVIGHREARVRREALRAIVALSGAAAGTHLRRVSARAAPEVAADAVGALARIAHPDAVALLADVAADETVDTAVRLQAIEHLGKHPNREAGRHLRELAGRDRKLPRKLRRRAGQLAGARGVT